MSDVFPDPGTPYLGVDQKRMRLDSAKWDLREDSPFGKVYHALSTKICSQGTNEHRTEDPPSHPDQGRWNPAVVWVEKQPDATGSSS